MDRFAAGECVLQSRARKICLRARLSNDQTEDNRRVKSEGHGEAHGLRLPARPRATEARMAFGSWDVSTTCLRADPIHDPPKDEAAHHRRRDRCE